MKIILILLRLPLIIIRLPLIIIHVFVGILILLLFFPKQKLNMKNIHSSIVVIWMKILRFLFGLKIKIKGKVEYECSVYVSNHISYLDIIVLNSILPVHFIAKSEIYRWPIIGYLTSKSGNLFIKRGDRESSKKIISSIRDDINFSNKIVFFPEGRIGDGVTVKKFHSKLFNSIEKSGKKVQPIFIRYPKKYPYDLSSNKDIVANDDSETLFAVSINCLGKLTTEVLLNFEKEINTSLLSAEEIAKQTFNLVSKSKIDLD